MWTYSQKKHNGTAAIFRHWKHLMRHLAWLGMHGAPGQPIISLLRPYNQGGTATSILFISFKSFSWSIWRRNCISTGDLEVITERRTSPLAVDLRAFVSSPVGREWSGTCFARPPSPTTQWVCATQSELAQLPPSLQLRPLSQLLLLRACGSLLLCSCLRFLAAAFA